ncbi:MAG: hypothetical protein A3E82_04435 [Gammaproteobacteria bacterium RIFCSPHIGHO2_12_FULL_38_11]|nr:MAG: hypothetical protein A3E82_04435 [Gammaproteobacteria bacterium RIFCSPHIGHO2_12_FULL_38_11]
MSRQNVLETQFAKKLPATALEALTTPDAQLHLDSPMSAHAAFVFTHIYSNPYPKKRGVSEKRHCHGMSHVSRVAAYVPVLANLYRKHNDSDAQQLSTEDIQLLQIAALFHDSAREDDEHDRWDNESATLLYVYLTCALNVSKEKAVMIAEATANKDYKSTFAPYQKISENENGEIIWRAVEAEKSPDKKNIYQKIIHDADCLDIIRARPAFDASYLDFHKDIAKTKPEAFKEMAILITEARGLIEDEGDTYRRLNPTKKTEYECTEGLQKIQQDIRKTTTLMSQLGGNLFSVEKLKTLSFLTDEKPYLSGSELSSENLRAALREGKIFARGIIFSSCRAKKHDESLTALELRKTFRATGIPTQSKKDNRVEKSGNPSRSVTMLGHGTVTYARAGFLVLDPTLAQIEKVHGGDAGTGVGKKLAKRQTESEKSDALKKLHFQQQKGGFTAYKRGFSHNEITYHVDHYDAIYYSSDTRVEENGSVGVNKLSCCEIMGKLNAIFLQHEYKTQYHQTKQEFLKQWPEDGEARFLALHGTNDTLPIIKYSGAHNHIELESAETFSEDNIVKMWGDLAEITMRNDLLKEHDTGLCSCSIDDLKIYCMYEGMQQVNEFGRPQSADSNYPPELKERVSKEIEERRAKVLTEDRKKLEDQLSIYSEDDFDLALLHATLPALLKHPDIFHTYRQSIEMIIETALRSSDFAMEAIFSGFGTHGVSYFLKSKTLPSFSDAAQAIANMEDKDPNHYSPDIILFFVLAKKLGMNNLENRLKEQTLEFIQNELSLPMVIINDPNRRLTLAKEFRMMMHIFGVQDVYKKDYADFLWNLSTLYHESHDYNFQKFDELYSELIQDAEIHQVFKDKLQRLEKYPPENFDAFVDRVAIRRYLKMDLPSCDELVAYTTELQTRNGGNDIDQKNGILKLLNTQDEKDAVVTVFLKKMFADIQNDLPRISYAIFNRCIVDIQQVSDYFSEKTKAIAISSFDSILAMVTQFNWDQQFLSYFTKLMMDLKLLGMPVPSIIIEKIHERATQIIASSFDQDSINKVIEIFQSLPSDPQTLDILKQLEEKKSQVTKLDDQQSSPIVGFTLGQFRKNTIDTTVNDNIAVKKIFSEHPPKSGSFWHGKDLASISFECIMRHALGENNKGFFGGHSGTDTKKALQDYGIKFDKEFLAMSIDEKVRTVSKAINAAPQQHALSKAAEAQGPKK